MFSFRVALRFLASNKLQTLLIVLGIAVGVSVQVFIGSLIQGLQNSLIDSTIGSSSHITVTSSERNETVADDASFFSTLQGFDERIVVVSKTVDGSGSMTTDTYTDPVVIRGFEFAQANTIYGFDDKLIDGALPVGAGEMMLGKDLVDETGLSLGDTVSVFIPETSETHTVLLVGVFDFRVTSINKSWFVMDLGGAKSVLSSPGLSSYEIQITDVFASDALAASLRNNIGNDFAVTEWQSANQELLSGLEGQSISSLMIQIFVMVSVVLGISSVLAITVLQKSKQLGILKAMGTNDAQASKIFLFEGFLLGIFGAVIGVLLGLLLAVMFTVFAVNPDGTPVVALYINPAFIAMSASIAVFASLVAAFLPARRSAKLDVIEVIRNG